MGTKQSSLPVFKGNMFAFEKRQEFLNLLVPKYHDSQPTPDLADGNFWGVEGVEEPGSPDRILIAANIGDVEIPDPSSETGLRTVSAEDIAAVFVSARFGKLSEDFPDLDLHQGDEVFPVLPKLALQGVYEQGLSVAPESTFPQRAEPVGQVSVGARAGVVVPVPAPA